MDVQLKDQKKMFTPKTAGKSRALVGCGGVLKGGAFMAGWLARLNYGFGESLGEFFNGGMYLSSVSAYEGTFALANQPRTIANTWINYIDGRKLVNPFNYFIGRETIKLGYLTELFKSPESWLNTLAVLNGTRPTYVMTDLETGEPVYRRPVTKEDLFNLMEATCAIPGLSKSRIVDGRKCVDGSLSVGFPIARALEDAHDEILVLSGHPAAQFDKSSTSRRATAMHYHFLKLRGRSREAVLCRDYGEKLKEAGKLARDHPNRVEIVTPENNSLSHSIDAHKNRLKETVQDGWVQGGRWLYEHGYKDNFVLKIEKELLETLLNG